MLQRVLLLSVAFAACCAAAEVARADNSNATKAGCAALLQQAGTSGEFSAHVAHVVHSLTVRDLRMFEPAADESNRIPTINYDLQADEAILPFAPDRREPDDEKFHTLGLQLLNGVLSHMDNKNFVVKNFNVLARVVHEFHMQEVWEMVRQVYERLKKSPPAAATCACARDVSENGVLKHLRDIAIQIREPQLVYGSSIDSFNRPGNGEHFGRQYNVQYNVQYRFRRRRSADVPTPQLSVLKKEQDGLPELNNEAAWAVWKKQLLSMDDASHTDAAVFLYCALQEYQSSTATQQSHAGHSK